MTGRKSRHFFCPGSGLGYGHASDIGRASPAKNPGAFPKGRPGREDIVDEKDDLAGDDIFSAEGVSSPDVIDSFPPFQGCLGRRGFHFQEGAGGKGDSRPPPDFPGDFDGLIEASLPTAPFMEGNGDNQVDSKPEFLVLFQRLVRHSPENPAQRPEPPVLQEQQGVFKDAPIPAGRSMPAKRGRRNGTGAASMRLRLPLEKPPANRAGGRSVQLDPVQAIRAEDPVTPVLEKRAANFAERGEEDQAG